VVERAQQVENPLLVLENLQYIRENMNYSAFMNRRLHGWAFAKLHAQIQYKAEEAGIPVATVNPRNTSKECHVCGETGTRPQQATFRCTNDDCWVREYQADVNAALNIADRYRGRESQPQTDRDSGQKAADNDSATDGGRFDRATRQPLRGRHPPGDEWNVCVLKPRRVTKTRNPMAGFHGVNAVEEVNCAAVSSRTSCIC
jgi:IS605 OrfB family transposase